MREYQQAELLYQRALRIKEKALGQNHYSVAISLNNLATLYASQKQYTKAEPLYKQSIMIFEKSLGVNHPSLATVLESYANLLRRMNRDDEAATIEARAKAIRAK
jgi:tetratricopeptide (TPR) repeat protein